MKYQGYGRFIVHRTDAAFQKYELMYSEVTQFGHSVPFKKKPISIKSITSLDLENGNKIPQPHEWLSDYVSNSMPYDLENMIDAYDFEVDLDGFAEVCGFLLVTDTTTDGPDGREYDSELSLEEPSFTKFKLEDLKDSYYYNAWTVAEWTLGPYDEDAVDKLYKKLVEEGYGKTWEHLEEDQEEMNERTI